MKKNYLKQAFAVLRFGLRILKLADSAKNPAEKLRFLAIFGAFLEEFFALRIPRLSNEKIPTKKLKKVAKKMNTTAETLFFKVISQIPEILKLKDIVQDIKNIKFFKEKIEPALKKAVDLDDNFKFKSNTLYIILEDKKIVEIPQNIPFFLKVGICEKKIIFLTDLITAFLQNQGTLLFAVENMLLNIPVPFDFENFETYYLKKTQPIILFHSNGDFKSDVFLLKSENKSHFLPLKKIFDLLKVLDLQISTLPTLPALGLPFQNFPKKDVFLNHPYHNFEVVLQLIAMASNDSNVDEIYISLYRTIYNSQLILNLKNAAQKGKKVCVFIELLARQNEQENVHLFKDLKNNGIFVFAFQNGCKLHAKTLLIKRGNHFIAHVSTGNYNEKTASQYIDCGIITKQKEITKTIYNLFKNNFFIKKTTILNYSPNNLHEKLLYLIQKETRFAQRGKRAKIIAKINALTEPQLIAALQNAAENGVKIRLIVRGASLLRPQKNIQIISVLGRYLEHARIIYFHHDGEKKCYISSADWMPRNFFSRIELFFPILNKKIKRFLIQNTLQNYFKCSHFEMQKNGHYVVKNLFKDAQIQTYQKLLKGL